MGGVEKDVTLELKKILSDGLEEIASHYRVSTDLTAVMYANHANYPKGNGELFQT